MFCLFGVLFVLLVQTINPIDGIAIAWTDTNLLLHRFIFPLLLFLKEFKQILAKFLRFLLLWLSLAVLSFSVSGVNSLYMLLVVFLFILSHLLQLLQVLDYFLGFVVDDFLVFLSIQVVWTFFLFEEGLLVLRHSDRVIDIFSFICVVKAVLMALDLTTRDLDISLGSSWNASKAVWYEGYFWSIFLLVQVCCWGSWGRNRH